MRHTGHMSSGFSNQHYCNLSIEDYDDGVPRVAPFAPRIWKLIYFIRQLGTISPKSALCNQYFRSRASIRREKIRHLTKYKYTIHPLSMCAEIQQIFMVFLWLALLMLMPFMSSFMPRTLVSKEPTVMILNLLALGHIIWTFFLGYIESQTGEVVLERRRIARRYMATYFWIDFIPAFISIFLYNNPFISKTTKYLLYQLAMLRFLRLRSMIHYIDGVLQLLRFKDSFRICFILFLMEFLNIHWWTCLINFLGVMGRVLNYKPLMRESGKELPIQEDVLSTDDMMKRYFQLANLVICHFYGAFIHTYGMLNDYQMMLLALVLIHGLSVYLFTAATMLQLFGMVNFSESKYEEMVSAVTEYMRLKNFPEELQKHISLYYDFKFEKKYFLESEILNSLSEHLRLEVLLYSCYHLIDRVEVFKGLPKPAVGCILALLQQDLFLPGELVSDDDDISETLYFILYGTCGMFITSTKPPRELHHLEDGSHFGDTNQMMDIFHTNFSYKIIALEACETYYLDKKSVRFCSENYPEIGEKLEELRYKGARLLIDYMNSSMVHLNEGAILTDLRHGRILEAQAKNFGRMFT